MTDSTSSDVTVVGLFRDRGSAENARNRLKTEKLASEEVPSRIVLEFVDAISGISRVPSQAARSIG